jgi:uncharacterized protein
VKASWDPDKAHGNIRKHRVSFEEAATVFQDPLAITEPDATHGDRLIIVGVSGQQRLLLCVYVEIQDDEIRIISARRTTSHERRRYEEEAL